MTSKVGPLVLNTPSNSINPATLAPFPPAMGPFNPFGAPPRVVAPANFGNNVGEVTGFPDYADGNGDGYPENTNQLRIAVGFRTGNHTGSSVRSRPTVPARSNSPGTSIRPISSSRWRAL
jgi:hypothetical protein